MLDYKLIEALAMVVREGGFEKGAKALHISQSAVSQRIRLLEEQMGQVLLTRTTPPRPTSGGQKVLKHYLQVNHLEQDLVACAEEGTDPFFSTMSVGVNADSLATWFLNAIHSFLIEEQVLLDIRVDDQEQTHQLLRDGEVMGCITTLEQPMQGCRIDPIGRMTYRMVATPGFADRWFPNGITMEAASRAPAVTFNRKDTLHQQLLTQAFEKCPKYMPIHYVPSAEKFADFIASGLAYGMLPEQQIMPLAESGGIIDLTPGYSVAVNLYWQCWNLNATLLKKLSEQLIQRGRLLLAPTT